MDYDHKNDYEHDYDFNKEKSKHRDRKMHKHKNKDWDDHNDWHDDFYDHGCKKDSHSCVCKTVREINDAQHKVSRKKHGCKTSCERSIKELLNQSNKIYFDTIPFKLLCGCGKGDCESFIGTGVVKINGCFYEIHSTFFRVVKFVKGSKCCAILELLCPERCEENHKCIQGFIRTGACFEVDLRDFVSITCFPPVKAKKMDPKKLIRSGR